jgi:hypothetical protein
MNSYAALAHTAVEAAPAFNATFYATAATVIPVFFLALAVQGRAYGDVLRRSRSAMARWRIEYKAAGKPFRWVALYLAWLVMWLIAAIILVVGFNGEMGALTALYQQRPDHGVLLSALVLLVAVAAIPGVALVKFFVSSLRIALGAAEPPAGGPDQAPGRPVPPEDDRPGAAS